MQRLKKLIKPIVTSPRIARRLCKGLLVADNWLDQVLNELVPYSESGVHPKHRLMNYHQFFLDHIKETDRVLDVGCGHGIVAYDLATRAKSVLGVDLEKKKIAWAETHFQRPNLRFLVADVRNDIPSEIFDVIVLSNVLEHLQDRVAFLTSVSSHAPTLLIRVPMIRRDWVVLYKKELGLDYRLDKTHFIEYTESELIDELAAAGLILTKLQVSFGEYWIVAQRQ